MESHFQDKSAASVVSVGDALLRESTGVKRSLGNNKAFFSSRASRVVNVGSSSKSLSTCGRRPKDRVKRQV